MTNENSIFICRRKISKVVTAATLIASFFLIFLENAIQIGIWKKYIFTVSSLFHCKSLSVWTIILSKKQKNI